MDIAQLKADLDAAEAAELALIEERRANRVSMTKAEFQAYNDDTRQDQKDLARAVKAAEQALHSALNNKRQEILVEAIGEGSSQGGVA